MKDSNYFFKGTDGKETEFTADNFIAFLDSAAGQKQTPYTPKERAEIEQRYKDQLDITVKVYYDGKRNVIKFI